MGASSHHRRRFLLANPVCAFCGGKVAATTIEHCPPRAMFQYRQWPEGFEFPACEACNSGTGDHDLLIAMLARMDPFTNQGNKDEKLIGLMQMANKQYPGMFKKMMPSAIEARRQNRELGIQPAAGQSHQDTGVVKIPDEIHEAVCVLARKLAKGVFYREVATPFPDEGCLLLNWFTNSELFRTGQYMVFDLLKELSGTAPPLLRSGQYLNDQFEYKLSLSADKTTMVLQARFGNTFGLVVFGSSIVGLLEASVTRLREQTERSGPFAVLQSTTLS